MKNIKFIRQELDIIDEQLIELLEQRFNLSKEIGQVKSQNKLPVYDKSREQSILEKIKMHARLNHSDSIARIYQLLFDLSKELQKPND